MQEMIIKHICTNAIVKSRLVMTKLKVGKKFFVFKRVLEMPNEGYCMMGRGSWFQSLGRHTENTLSPLALEQTFGPYRSFSPLYRLWHRTTETLNDLDDSLKPKSRLVFSTSSHFNALTFCRMIGRSGSVELVYPMTSPVSDRVNNSTQRFGSGHFFLFRIGSLLGLNHCGSRSGAPWAEARYPEIFGDAEAEQVLFALWLHAPSSFLTWKQTQRRLFCSGQMGLGPAPARYSRVSSCCLQNPRFILDF